MKTVGLGYTRRCGDGPDKGHNRWRPDIPPAFSADHGKEVVRQTRKSLDLQVIP